MSQPEDGEQCALLNWFSNLPYALLLVSFLLAVNTQHAIYSMHTPG